MTTEEAKKNFEAIKQQNKANWPTLQNPNIDFSVLYNDYSQELPPIIIYDFKLNKGDVIGTDSSGILVFKRKYEGRDLLISNQKIIPSFKIGECERLTFDGKKFILRQNVSSKSKFPKLPESEDVIDDGWKITTYPDVRWTNNINKLKNG